MRKSLKSYLDTSSETKVNPVIAQGVAWDKTKNMLLELDNIYKETCLEFPDYIKFEGIEIVDPFEYSRMIMNKGVVAHEEILWSDVYLINIKFSYKHENGSIEYMDNYVYVPYISRGGIFVHSNVKYCVVPVLTDRVISVKPEENSIFIKLLTDKINFYFRTPTSTIINGKKTLIHIVDLVHRARPDSTVKLNLTNTLYVLGKYGYTGMFKKYYGVVPEIIDSDTDISKIDLDKVWVFMPDQENSLHHIKYGFILEKKGIGKKRYNDIGRVLSAMFYTLGNIAVEHTMGSISISYDKDSLDSTIFWRIIISNVVRGSEANITRSLAVISDRFNKMDNYLDGMSRRHLKLRGIHGINDFYDLLEYIGRESISLIKENGNDTWSKYPEVNYYLLYGFITKINNAKNTLVKMDLDDRENGNKPLSIKKVKNILNITARFIFRTISGGSRSLAISDTNYTGDNMLIGTGILTELQENGNGVFRKPKKSANKLTPLTSTISGYQMVVGNVLGIHKRMPTALATLSPFIRIDNKTGSYIVSDKIREDTKKVDYYFKNSVVHKE